MKFTEGYWEKNERANASYAMQAFTAEAIPGGMRIVSPFREINWKVWDGRLSRSPNWICRMNRIVPRSP